MALTFYLSNDTSDLGAADGFNRYLNDATGTAGSISISLTHGGPIQMTGYAFTRSGALSSATWTDDSITVYVKVTTSAEIDLRLTAARVNDSGVIQTEGSQSAYISLNTTGVKTFTIASNGGWGTPSDTDRLRIDYDFFYPEGAKGGRTIEFETNTADAAVITPFSIVIFDPPAVTTNAASPIGETTATLNGNLTDLGSSTSVDVFFEYKAVGAPTWIATTKQVQSAIGTFNQSISALDQGTEYEFRAVVEYEDGGIQRVEGSTLTFDTNASHDVSDSLTLNITDTSSTTTTTSTTDSTTLTITEDTSIAKMTFISDTDTLSIGLEEVALTTSAQPLLDSTAISLQEQANVEVTSASTDNLALQINDDDTNIAELAPKNDTDTIVLSITETTHISTSTPVTDNITLTITEAFVSSAILPYTDNILVSIDDIAERQEKMITEGYIIRRRIGTEGEWETIAQVEAKMDETRVPILSGRMMADYVELTTD